MSRFEEARRLALSDPTLCQSDIARLSGLSREGVRIALKRDGIVVRDGRGGGRRRGAAQAAALTEARRKIEDQAPLTRDERHAVWQDYRRRAREVAAS